MTCLARKKIALTDQQIVAAILNLDLNVLTNEYLDLLLHVVPNEAEVKAFNNYESDNKPISALSPTDQFMLQVLTSLILHLAVT